MWWALILVPSIAVTSRAEGLPTIHGRVLLDENGNGTLDEGEPGLAGVAVTDGVQVVLTDDDGKYQLKFARDEVIPYTPARTVAVSWPSGFWPRGRWYYRVSELRLQHPVDFLLQRQDQELPFGIVQGTDPHDCFRREFNRTWRDDVRRMGDLIDLAVVTGDLSYISRKNVDKDLGDVRKFTDAFPVPMFHAPGNHDIADIHTPKWKEAHDLAGNGGFTKHLGPVRWSFDYAGVHLVGVDWARPFGDTLETGMPTVTIDWLERDLARLPKGTRTFLFAHQFWSPNPKLLEVARKYNVELMLGGHSHRNIDLSSGDVKMITTMSLSKLVHVYADRHELVDFCQGYRANNPDYHGKFCHLVDIRPIASRRGEVQQIGLTNVTQKPARLTKAAVGPGFELTATLRFDTDTTVIVQLTPEDRSQAPVKLTLRQNLVQCDGLTTTAGRRPNDPHYKLHLLLDHGGLEVKVNGRVYFCRTKIQPQGTWHVSVLAPEGGALVAEAQVWPIATGDPKSLEQVAIHYRNIYQGERAAPYWRAILKQDANHVAANLGLGKWLMDRGRGDDAEPFLKIAAKNDVHKRQVTLRLAEWYGTAGRESDAVNTYKSLLKVKADLEIKNKLAWLYLTAQDLKVRNAKSALQLARELCQATENKEARFLDTLCVALAETGDLRAALETAQLGFDRASEKNDRILTENMRMRLTNFKATLQKQGKP